MDQKNLQMRIRQDGHLKLDRTAYELHSVELFGPKRIISDHGTKPGKVPPKSEIITVGEQPEGFGKQVVWDPADAGLALVIFINAADSLGVMISGVKATDTIDIVSANGIASFAEDTENENISSLIGIAAAGADLAASAFGAPEAAPLIAAGAKYAQDSFQEEKVRTKRRDAFGEDPGSGLKARAEGGPIVSLPSAGKIYYSGDSDHQERWIKQPGTRDDQHLPDHVRDAFFLQGYPKEKRTATEAGDIFICAWDWFFEDNFGFYQLHVLLQRGSGKPPIID
jgi:hypothetical protein